ncbi:hypothetical protein E1B28_004654 [Marasmius oreades]|uniref:Uncharacterized protein n=1 Tax=Marasmius oreades TaxID=181124 RepID=A0A9P8AD72_9AGAR|nr:uncharacterized protein E1B28_004654 [Marasmius oreades]KAG7097289.1 hypothetical protein E1B28_004654 [Marasmius oreades]
MLLAQRVDLTFSSFETKSIALSHPILDAPLAPWSSSRLSSWETTQLASVVGPTSPLILDEEFVKDKVGAESPSTSPSCYSDFEVHEGFSTPYIPRDLRQLCEGEESDAEDDEHSKLDVDCVISVVQLASTGQAVDSEDESMYDEWDSHDQDDIIPFLYGLKQSIFLESMYPKIAPHIVITLCEDTWDDHTIAWYTRVDIQSPNYLCVPPTDVSEFVLHPHHDFRIISDLPATLTPPLVFNHTKFQKLINRCSIERLIMFEVILVLRKHLCRTVVRVRTSPIYVPCSLFRWQAFEASKLALALRQRYDGHLPFEKIESSFHWTDPAESLISCYRRYHGTTFIESSSPFRVPHIVISAPPPENPWFKWLNQVNDPQDSGFGRYLVVPARGVGFINELEDPFHDYYAESEVYGYDECSETSFNSTIESYRFFIADDLEEDNVSFSPETPTDRDELQDFKTGFERALGFKFGKSPLEDQKETQDLSDDDLSLTRCGISVLMDRFNVMECEPGVEHPARPSCQPHVLPLTSENDWSSFDDNDGDNDAEDDLPPLDEWYQSVMRRADALQTVSVS